MRGRGDKVLNEWGHFCGQKNRKVLREKKGITKMERMKRERE